MSAATQQLRESFERFSKSEEPATLGDEDTVPNLEVTIELQRAMLDHHASVREQLKSEIEKIIKANIMGATSAFAKITTEQVTSAHDATEHEKARGFIEHHMANAMNQMKDQAR